MKQHFAMLANYNRWANERIYDAAGELDEDEWRRDVSAFFVSLCGTLNHILVADRIWMRRFSGTGPTPVRLDECIASDREKLRSLRAQEDTPIIDWIDTLSDDAFQKSFSYTTVTDGKTISQLLGSALAHLFNHQTHHRGQAHGILSQLGKSPPSLDLIYFQRTAQPS